MFAWIFILAAVRVGGILGWKPALARYYVYKLETGDHTAGDKLEKLGPAAIPVLIGAIGSGRKPEAEPELSSILRTFGDPGEKALLAAYHGENRDMVRRARLAWALRGVKTEDARKAYHQAVLDERLGLYRFRFAGNDREWPVRAALWALAARQEDDGRWSASRWGARGASDIEVTALVVLAFTSYGETRSSGLYSFEIGRAIEYLTKAQDQDGRFGSGSMREHALAGTAMAAAYGVEMTRGAPLALGAGRAVEWTVARQERSGGWADVPGAAPDAFTSALCVMQLKSAKISGLSVAKESLERVLAFFDALTVPEDDGPDRLLVRPRPGERPTPRSAASAALVRSFLGVSSEDPQMVRLADEAAKCPADFIADPWAGCLGKFAFLWRGECWQKWIEAERKTLKPAQTPSGVNYGLWPPNAADGHRLGLAGYTALRALEMDHGSHGYVPMYTK